MNYALPKAVEVNGLEYPIRYDWRAILDILGALQDPELDSQEKSFVAFSIFYVDLDAIPPKDYGAAGEALMEFINGGQKDARGKAVKLMDWEQDLKYIIPPVNRVLGTEIRELPELHWWTFLDAYMEIGDCLFAQIVRIRRLNAKGKKKDKADAEWYRENRELVDFKTRYTDAEKDLFKQWGV